jgi:hypothetical protein
MIHTRALPDVVPSEVMTGGPLPNPNTSEECATWASDGAPVPVTPYL